MAPRKRKDKHEPEHYDRLRAKSKKQNSGAHASYPAIPSSSSKSVDSVQREGTPPGFDDWVQEISRVREMYEMENGVQYPAIPSSSTPERMPLGFLDWARAIAKAKAMMEMENGGEHARDPPIPSERMSPRKDKDNDKPAYYEMLRVVLERGNSGEHAKDPAIPSSSTEPVNSIRSFRQYRQYTLKKKPRYNDYIRAKDTVHEWEMENKNDMKRLCDSGTEHSTSSSSESDERSTSSTKSKGVYTAREAFERRFGTKFKLESLMVELEERTRILSDDVVAEFYCSKKFLRQVDDEVGAVIKRTGEISEMLMDQVHRNVQFERQLEAESKAREDDRVAMEAKIEQMVLQKMTEFVQGMRPPPLP